MMRSLGQVPNNLMDRPVTVQLHVHKERGMVCLRPVKVGAQILTDVNIAHATGAFESVHVPCCNSAQNTQHMLGANIVLLHAMSCCCMQLRVVFSKSPRHSAHLPTITLSTHNISPHSLWLRPSPPTPSTLWICPFPKLCSNCQGLQNCLFGRYF